MSKAVSRELANVVNRCNNIDREYYNLNDCPFAETTSKQKYCGTYIGEDMAKKIKIEALDNKVVARSWGRPCFQIGDEIVGINGATANVTNVNECSSYPVITDNSEQLTLEGKALSYHVLPLYFLKGSTITVEDKYGKRVYKV